VDRAGWHTSKRLALPEGLTLWFLPAYTPQLNPAERLWPSVREAVANWPVSKVTELEQWQKVEAALELKNQILVKVYNRRALQPDEVVETVLGQAEHFAHRIADTRLLLNQALELLLRLG